MGVGTKCDRLPYIRYSGYVEFFTCTFFAMGFSSSSSFNSLKLNMLSITGRDQTGYTVHAGFCMFPQSCDLRTETAGSL
jgi:hypothetical protein